MEEESEKEEEKGEKEEEMQYRCEIGSWHENMIRARPNQPSQFYH